MSDAALNELKQSRAVKKASMTRINTKINERTLTANELACRLKILEKYFADYLDIQDSIDNLKPSEREQEDYRESMEDLYCTIKTKIATLTDELSVSDQSQSLSLSAHSSVHCRDDLPRIKPPTFSGEYTEYNTFIQQFRATVDEKPIPTIRKFQLLVDECLKGNAKLSLQSLDVTEENCLKALDILKQRYDNKCIVFQSHIRGLYNITAVPKNSGSHLRRFVDDVDVHLGALRSLGSDTDIVNALLIHIASIKLDPETYAKLDETFELQTLPTWKECSIFLNKRSQHLDIREPQSRIATSSSKGNDMKYKLRSATTLAVAELRCAFCNATEHNIGNCNKFTELPVYHRFRNVKRIGLCINCLNFGHSVKDCSSSNCKVCKQPHHSLLHRFQSTTLKSNQTPIITRQQDDSTNQYSPITSTALHSGSAQGSSNSYIFLATAIVNVKGVDGVFVPTRILLDSGSQLNLISERLAQRLGLKRTNFNGELSAVGNISVPARQKTSTSLRSRLNNIEINLNFWILPSITSKQPEVSVDIKDWNIPSDIPLADPCFNTPKRIDMLIGADVFFELLTDGQFKLKEELPLFKNTVFGWIVVGKYNAECLPCQEVTSSVHSSTTTATDISLSEMLEKFLAIEDVTSNTPNWTEEQLACENAFKNSIQQRTDGRFVVQLPFKDNPNVLGDSKRIATKRFLSLEKQLQNSSEIKKQYIAFLREYESLGHMEVVPANEVSNVRYFMPHHFVLRPDSSSTKLRVVFDASCRTTSNISLNEILMVGPTVQKDLFSISLRFRSHKIALTADIPKMYRQFFVRPSDANYQGILWRENPNQEIRVYRLTTVTYGTSSAPYHATRCLLYLAEKHQLEFPLGAAVIKNDFYIDDLISGANTLEEAEQIRREVESILIGAGLQLKKWFSNDAKMMDRIPVADHETPLRINDSDVIKALGIVWQPSKDEFQFVNPLENVQNSSLITKRNILADVARLFDPLGLINPVIVLGKVFLQRLWIAKVEWDEELNDDLKDEWVEYRSQLWELSQVRVPRYIFGQDIVRCELHGFSDASMKAFGCCIYARVEDSLGNISLHLVSAKSKVAPVSTQSLPRLEPCAALLLSKLLRRILDAFDVQFDEIFLWTDSEIVLDWIADHPSSWNTFIANRVAIIQNLTLKANWRHVNTKSNPADIISRGSLVADLMKSIWFTGPEFLYHPPSEWPARTKRATKNVLERRKIQSVLVGVVSKQTVGSTVGFEDIVGNHKFINNYKKLIRIFAFCNRFIENIKRGLKGKELVLDEIKADEFDAALLRMIYVVQQIAFKDEIANLQSRSMCVSSKSRLRKLNPYIQIDSLVPLIRVGGRLELSELPYDTKHPILLPKSHPFVECFLDHLHFKYHHAGAQALISISRQRVWIIDARNLATKIVHRCIRCFRIQPRLREQIMGDLPSSRVKSSRPFLVSGVDFCGPFLTKLKTKGYRITKSYLSVFVCFSTKAVHLEVVSDLTTNGFMAALRRFIARRGICRHLYCDNGTNFVGARNELAELKKQFLNQVTQSSIIELCAEENIEFHHIPPRSPHFGGLWESAVKSAKSLLIRSCNTTSLTFEELTTVTTEIEAILNSRPLTPLTSDPNDEQVLTPGHFLIGSPLTSFQEPDITNVSRLDRWQQLNSIRQHFWKRWSREYVSQLQYRYKWNSTSADLKPGTMVLVSDENLPPLKWLLGRIADTVRGKDGHVRVITIKTKMGVITRAINKVAPLPFESIT